MRLYRWFLRLCPASLRRDYGAAMEDTFARRLADVREAGRWQWARLWSRELAGLILLSLTERWGAPARVRRHRQRMQSGRKAGHMDGIVQELRLGWRRLARTPAFTLASVLTLALAIGANVSIFALVQRVVLNPLPYPESERLVFVDHAVVAADVRSGIGPTLGMYHQYLDRARTLDGIALYRGEELTLTGDGEPARIQAAWVTPSLAPVLRASSAHGRWFTDEEGTPEAPRAAVLSHGLWMRRYGGSLAVIGSAVTLGGVSTEIVGVMPPTFAFPDRRTEIWVAEPITRATGFGFFMHFGIARLREGATIDRARVELNELIADLPRAYPESPLAANIVSRMKLASSLVTLKESTIGRVALALWMLLASVGVVLVVACANIANLCLVRSEARQREIAVRRALGAGRFEIARYFLIESVLLSAAGGAIGLALGWGALRLLVSTGPANLPRLDEIRLDAVAWIFTSVLSGMAALIFGLIPVLHRVPVTAALHESGRGNTASRGRHRARHLLMGAQVALALVLLVASVLMVRSFQRLRSVDPGFDARSALTFRIGLPPTDYPDQRAVTAAHSAILDRLGAIPGVTSASASSCLPLAGICFGNTLTVFGRVLAPGDALPPVVAFRWVAADYHETMDMRLIRGRGIDRRDVDRGDAIAVVNQALADAYFPDQDAVGQRVAMVPQNPAWLTIVGVVSNTPTRSLAEPAPVPKLYMPMSTAPGGGPLPPGLPREVPGAAVSYVIRTAAPPLGLVPSVRREVASVDADLPLAQMGTLQDALDAAAAQMAFTMVLLAIAAGVALALGVIGIYGVISYVVSQRTGEIGVRLALGADPRAVAAMIVRQGGIVIFAGVTIGLAFAFAGSRLIATLLYGVSPRDPVVFAGTTAALVAVALFACWLPARRAARVSPIEALRAE